MARYLGQILKDLGYISEGDIERALEAQRAGGFTKRLGEVLMEGVLKEDGLLHGLSVQFNVPVLTSDLLPKSLPIDKISFDFLKKHLVLPLRVEDNTLSVAVADPSKTEALDNIRASFDYEIAPYIARGSVIAECIEQLQASKDAVMQRLIEGAAAEQGDLAEEAMGEVSHLRDLAQEKGIIQLVNIVIENAIKENASDIHVEPEETDVRVRYRIDGILYEREVLPLRMQAALSSRLKLLAQMNIAERRLPQDGRIKGAFGGKVVDIRVSTMPTVYGESIVMRILEREMSMLSLEEIGFDAELLTKYTGLIKRPYGMILITGPTGSGKTTTLYASLDKINQPDKKMITIEEPVEYLLKGINQIQVMPKIGLTFANGLRSIVRQDPDIIMVGEIRDLETAGISVHASLTGHLLFSTLHTNDAPSAVTRLIDMGVENYLVSSTLIGVMAQRLVRRICGECREPFPVPDDVRAEFGDRFKELFKGKGCPRCMNTGYRGRMAIFELMVIDDNIRDLIVRRATEREIRDRAIAAGMRSLRQDGLLKAERGVTTIEEVFRVTQAEVPQ